MSRWAPEPFITRFWAKVVEGETPDDCWGWAGSVTDQGYARFKTKCPDGRWRYLLAHRFSWEYAHATPVPDGLQLDHLCRNRICINPRHLEPVTNRTNVLRGSGHTAANTRKTRCHRGHPLSGANLSIKANGARRCLTCHREGNYRLAAGRTA
jgi:hypothetical protein